MLQVWGKDLGQLLKDSPKSLLLILTPLCNPIPLYAGWTNDLLLTNRIQDKSWEVMSEIRIKKPVILSYFHSVFPWLFSSRLLWWSKLPYYEPPVEREWPPANSQWGTKALWPTAHEELSAAKNDTNALGSGSFLDRPLMWTAAQPMLCSLWETLKQRAQLSHISSPDLQKIVRWEMLIQATKLRIICYAATGNLTQDGYLW